MAIAEPATILTDYALALLGFALGARLLGRESLASRRLFGASLVATGCAALTGGTSHGFAPHLSAEASAALWIATYTAIGVASLLILAGAAAAAFSPAGRIWAMSLLVVRLVGYLCSVLPERQFRFVVYDYALTLAALLTFAVHGRVTRSQPGAPWIAAGVLVSAGGAAIQFARLAPHPHFNHNDLFHVLQAVGVCLFYLGALGLADHRREGTRTSGAA